MEAVNGVYSQVTEGIKVLAMPAYVDSQSRPAAGEYVWMYTIQIENNGERTVQLLNRHWHITDAQGRKQEVKGAGVVGEQPTLSPGESFRYTSGTVLPTSSGIMYGTYEMEDEQGRRFDIAVPAFSLDSPQQVARAN